MADENKLPHLEYCKLDRASRLLGCEVNDLLHWAEIGAIQLCVRLTGQVHLYSQKANRFEFDQQEKRLAKMLAEGVKIKHSSDWSSGSGNRLRRMLICEEARYGGLMRGQFFKLTKFPLCEISFSHVADADDGGTRRWPDPRPKIITEAFPVCECNISGLVTFAFDRPAAGLGNDDIFRTLQEIGEIEIKNSFCFTPADCDKDNPPDYFISPVTYFSDGGMNENWGKTLLKISINDILITKKWIDKIRTFPDQSMPSFINNGVVKIERAMPSIDGQRMQGNNGRPISVAEQQDLILREAIKKSGIDPQNYRKTSGDKRKVKEAVGNQLSNSQFAASWNRLLNVEIIQVA